MSTDPVYETEQRHKHCVEENRRLREALERFATKSVLMTDLRKRFHNIDQGMEVRLERASAAVDDVLASTPAQDPRFIEGYFTDRVRAGDRVSPTQDQGHERDVPAGWSMRWRHVKRGSVVTEIGRGFAQVSVHPIEEMSAVVIYEHDGTLWVRNAVEFDDGRFEMLAAAPNPTRTEEQG